MIKIITVDFWNTIIDSSNGKARNDLRLKTLVEEIDKTGGEPVKQDKFDEALKAAWEYFNRIWKTEQKTPPTYQTVEYFWNYLQLAHDENAIKRLSAVFAESVLVFPPKLMEGAAENLELLSSNFKLGIISDTGFTPGAMLRKLMQDLNIIQYFGAFSFSDETGVSKPHRKAFHRVLDFYGAAPESAVHIGDIEDTDINGAKSIGMKAIRYEGDPTGMFSKSNPAVSKADATAFHWNEIPEIIANF